MHAYGYERHPASPIAEVYNDIVVSLLPGDLYVGMGVVDCTIGKGETKDIKTMV